ncbi:MAG: O-antigen ligase family protein [Clostridia bacterium]|nr:O-antigen ligase family protein [Clostridia bacterium]
MKKVLDKFFDSNIYIIFFLVVASLGWCLDLTFISYSILALMVCVNLLFRSDLSPSLLCLPSMMFVFNEYPTTQNYIIAFAISLSCAMLCLCVYLIREYKNNTLHFRFDKRCLIIFIAMLGMSLGGIFSEYFSINSMLFGFILLATTLIYYLITINFSKMNKKEFVFKMFLESSVILIVQLAFVYLSSGDMLSVIQKKQAYIGIGEINLPATVLAMAIPFFVYRALNSRYDWAYLLSAIIIYLFVVLTCCRGALLFATIFGVLAFIVYFIKTKRKIVPLAYTISIVVLAVVGIIFFKEQLTSVLQHFIERGFDDTGRFELWELGYAYFTQYPFFGVGLQAPTWSFPYSMFHCTIIQIFASLGIFGFVCFAIYFIDRYKYIFHFKNAYSVLAYCSILICAGYGLIDQTFTCAIFHILVLAILLSIEEDISIKKKELKQN